MSLNKHFDRPILYSPSPKLSTYLKGEPLSFGHFFNDQVPNSTVRSNCQNSKEINQLFVCCKLLYKVLKDKPYQSNQPMNLLFKTMLITLFINAHFTVSSKHYHCPGVRGSFTMTLLQLYVSSKYVLLNFDVVFNFISLGFLKNIA